MQLKIVLWNANGLAQRTAEVKTYIQTQNVHVMLISETHFTTRSYIKIPNYTIYATQHPDGTAHGGTAIIIQNSIKHHLHGHYTLSRLQVTSVTIEGWIGPFTIAAVYCPPKHTIKGDQFRSFYATLGNRFLAGGDYNAKHSFWGSRLTTPRGRELFQAMQANQSTGPVTEGKCLTLLTLVL
jgi:exonuclease III